MIETKVPKDIRKFKGKVAGPFTLRQLICVVAAIVIDVVLYVAILKPMGANSDTMLLVFTLCDFPVVMFIMEPYGMPMEIYLRKVLYKNIMYPVKRKNKTDLNTYKHEVSAEEQKQINKEYQKRMKENPEWKMYE